MSENMRCLSFGIWVFQNSRFQFCPFTCKFDEFIFLNRQIIPRCKCPMTHSSVGGHLRCFCCLAITNRAAMSTANSSLTSSKRAFEYQLQSDTVGSYGRPISGSLRNRLTDFCSNRRFYSHQQWGSVPLSHPWDSMCCHLLFFSFLALSFWLGWGEASKWF